MLGQRKQPACSTKVFSGVHGSNQFIESNQKVRLTSLMETMMLMDTSNVG